MAIRDVRQFLSADDFIFGGSIDPVLTQLVGSVVEFERLEALHALTSLHRGLLCLFVTHLLANLNYYLY